MKKLIVVSLTALALTGCASFQQKKINDALASAQLEAGKCREGEITRKNAIERRSCIDTIFSTKLREAGYAYMPLLMQVHAANKVLAVQFSEGKISQSEYEAGLQKNEADFALVESEYIPRNQQAQADAWHRAGMAMQQSMALQNQQNFQQQMLIQQNRPIQTNCNRFGSSINCTTW